MTKNERTKLYTRIALRVLTCIAVIFAVIWLLPWLNRLLAPFILAFIMAALLNPAVRFLNTKCKMSRNLSANILVILVFAIMAAAVSWVVYALTMEMVSLAQDAERITGNIVNIFNSIGERLHWIDDIMPVDADSMFAGFMESFVVWMQGGVVWVAEYLVTHTWDITIGIGEWLLALLMFLLAAGFMTTDFPKYLETLSKVKFEWLDKVKYATRHAFKGYIKSQFLLATLAAIVMYIGLIIIGQQYALVIAVLLWVLDFLPILGTGSLMVPWSIIVFIGGDPFKGIYLLILQSSFFIVRRILEPKVMGKEMNLSPILALISIFVGMKLAGFWGMIFGPILTIIFISIAKEGVFNNAWQDIQSASADLKRLFSNEDSEPAEEQSKE